MGVVRRVKRYGWGLVIGITSALLAGGACGGGGGTGSGEGGASNGSAPVPGEAREGWTSAWKEGGAGFSCGDDAASLRNGDVPRVSIGGSTLFVGFEQKGDNQNPLLARFDGDEQVYCVRHETQPPDSRALGVTWNGDGRAYVVYTTVGGGTALEEAGGWLGSYAPGAFHGGGAKVSFLGAVDVSDGALESGTFIIAVLSDDGINTHRPRSAPKVLSDGNVEFLGESAHKPIDPNGEQEMDCGDYPFESRYVFKPGLDAIVCAETSNCTSSAPCSDR